MTINYKIYCLNYDSPKRREDMQERFNKLNISPDNCVFYPGVSPDDPRISGQPFTRDHEHYKRVWSMAWGHLDMISLFLNDTSVSHGIFCEDDIYIHKYFSQFIYDTIIDFDNLKIDILLLGYLINHQIDSTHTDFKEINLKNKYNLISKYFSYPHHLWGTQMYLISKAYAQQIIDTFTLEYAVTTLTNSSINPFSSDHTITKPLDEKKRALIWPPFACENNTTSLSYYTEYDSTNIQYNYHMSCSNFTYSPHKMI